MKYFYYSFLILVGVFVLEIIAYFITEARKQNEEEEARRREKKEQGSKPDTLVDASADEASKKNVTSWILFFVGLVLFIFGLSFSRAISVSTDDSLLDFVIMMAGIFLMILPCVYAVKKREIGGC